MEHEEEPHPFYGFHIQRDQQQEFVRNLLEKYREDPVDEELKKKIWNELQREKFEGRLTMPFKVVMRRDPAGQYPDCVEVILDTKV